MDTFHEGQRVWVEQADGSQRPAIFVGEAEKPRASVHAATGPQHGQEDRRHGEYEQGGDERVEHTTMVALDPQGFLSAA
jgi:hypothetical protein